MPPVVRLALWYRLIGSVWVCPLCSVRLLGGFGGKHIVERHPYSVSAKESWIGWFDREVASLWL